MSSVIDSIERRQQRQGIPRFEPGDRVRVHFQVVEGSRRRTQVFEGIVLKRQGSGARETFTVRKQSFGVGVERTFPLHSPKIEKLEIAARGDVRRAKLYYLRGRIGKAARVAERRWGIDEELISTPTTSAEPGAVDAEGVTIDEAEAFDRGEAPETEAEGEAPEGEAEGDEAPAAEAPESEAAESGQEDAEADAGDEAEPAAGSEGAAEPDSETLETNEPESSETETPTAAEEEAAEEDPTAADEGEQSGDSDKDQA
jgi:large subunit ribosomal protein L19